MDLSRRQFIPTAAIGAVDTAHSSSGLLNPSSIGMPPMFDAKSWLLCAGFAHN